MVYLSIAFLCSILLFLTLLDDKYRLSVAAISYGAVYVLSLGLTKLVGHFSSNPEVSEPISMMLHGALLFLLSLFIYHNNPIQKLYLAVLSISNYLFIKVFSAYLLGLIPFSVSGVFAALFSVFLYIFFTALMILCLHRVFHHFHDRDTSGFIIIVTLLQSLPCIFSIGRLDFLFEAHIYAGRIFFSAAIYVIILFSARSIYQAARFRQAMTRDAARQEMLETQSSRYIELYTYIQELRRRREEENYRLETIEQMLKEGAAKKVPVYIESLREAENASALLSEYTENPYLNAVLATNAAYAEIQEIDFTCSILFAAKTISTSDICLITSEMLHKALKEVANYSGKKRICYTVSPADDTLKLELIYSTSPPVQNKPAMKELFNGLLKNLKDKKLSNILADFFDDHSEELFDGLSCTCDIVNRYSGRMDISTTEESIIISVQIHI